MEKVKAFALKYKKEIALLVIGFIVGAIVL